jgi:hypothetical protein
MMGRKQPGKLSGLMFNQIVLAVKQSADHRQHVGPGTD